MHTLNYIVLLIYLLGGGALFAESEASPISNNIAIQHDGEVNQIGEKSGGDGRNRLGDRSRVRGVVTLVDTNRSLAVIQDGESARAFELDLKQTPLLAGEQVELQGMVSKLTTAFPDYPDEPDGSSICADFEAPTNLGQFYLGRMQGILRAPVTGEYTFWIASDDSSELWLANDGNPQHVRKIAYVEAGRWTKPRQWMRFPTQQSAPIFLKAGVPCYIEALHQQITGEDCLAVAWQGSTIHQSVIQRQFLSPCDVDSASGEITRIGKAQGVLREYWTNFLLADLSRLHVANASIRKLHSVHVLSHEPGSPPEPMNTHPGERLANTNDFRWMELQGTVRFCVRTADQLRIELAAGQSSVQAVVRGDISSIPMLPENSLVRVVGVGELAVGSANRRRLATIWVHGGENVVWLNTDENWNRFHCLPTYLLSPTNSSLSVGQMIHLQGVVRKQTEKGLWLMQGNDSYCGYVSSNGVTWSAVDSPVEMAMTDPVLAGFFVSSHQTNAAVATFDHLRGFSREFNGADIGAPPVPGDNVSHGSDLTIRGSGADVWSTSDQCHFAWQKLDGEADLSARLVNFSAGDESAKLGIMVRQTLGRRSPWAATVSMSNQRVGLQARREPGENAAGAVAAQSVNWLKLTRQRHVFQIHTRPGQTVQPGQRLDVLGRLSWQENMPLLEDIRFRVIPGEERKASISSQPTNSDAEDGFQMVRIKNLSKEEQSARLAGHLARFRIQGIVTFNDQVDGKRLFIAQDSSGGCPVRLPNNVVGAGLHAGDLIEAIGKSEDDAEVPTFLAGGLSRIGVGPLPHPQEFPFDSQADGWHHGQWTEIAGVARSVNANGELLVATRGGTLPVFGGDDAGLQFSNYVDASVRMRGVYWTNPVSRLLLPAAKFVDVEQPAPIDPFARPVFSISVIRGLGINAGSMHRMKIRGVVTCKRDGFFVIQDQTGGILVRPESSDVVKLGEGLQVVGFPTASPAGVNLASALWRQVESGGMPIPVPVPLNASLGEDWNQRLVTVEAVLLEQHLAHGVQYMDLQSGQRVFRATLPATGGKLEAIAPGSLVRVTGIAQIEEADSSGNQLDKTGKPLVASLELLLRNANDLTVIKRPPWWNWKYTAGTIALFCLALVLAFVWIKMLHRRVEESTHELRETMGKLQKETQVSATLAERDRLAGEIHDSVEQGLSAIMLQLDAAKQFVDQPEEVDRFLTLAKNMAGFSRSEVHHVVWGMQSPLLENADLPTALRRVAREISAGDTPRVTVDISGPARPLPSSIEHHLLRIGQEATTNAVKHARPKTIRLQLDYGADFVALTIEDDGCGFDPDVVQHGNGHFGLQGIRSRGRKINASLTILSQPGRGTRILAKIPLGTPVVGAEPEP